MRRPKSLEAAKQMLRVANHTIADNYYNYNYHNDNTDTNIQNTNSVS